MGPSTSRISEVIESGWSSGKVRKDWLSRDIFRLRKAQDLVTAKSRMTVGPPPTHSS